MCIRNCDVIVVVIAVITNQAFRIFRCECMS
jgi:hypothetical protein